MKTKVSTPGKVLITGGYLVLDPKYSGLVLATTARFYTFVEDLSENQNIIVISKQLNYKGEFKINEEGIFEKISGKENKFVETCLETTFNYLKLKRKVNVFIEIQSDNDFYSQLETLKEMNLPISSKSLEKVPHFNILKSFHKTGLGSSAALVSSIIGSLLTHFQGKTDLDMIHNLSQYCHNLAQGKIGSGFDISSCIFGSQKFKRSSKEYKFENINEKLNNYEKFHLPNGYELFLGEIHQGSNTPSMVSLVLKWKKENPTESQELFEKINNLNEKLESKLKQLCEKEDKELIVSIQETFLEIRKNLKYLGEKSKVEIEPDLQTKLIDETNKIEGVLFSGVPGAGGYDAIFAIIKHNSREKVEKLWIGMNVCPLLLKESQEGIKFF